MIRNYLKIAFRNLMKYKFISFINLFGLTVGLTCCLLITVYIINELSFDRFNPKSAQIYRVTRSFNTRDGVINLHLSSVAPPIGPLLKHEYPDIQQQTQFLFSGTSAIKYQEKLFNEKQVFFADEHFFDFFPATIVKGNGQTALKEERSIMLTEEVARKYFGSEDPINKMVRVDNNIYCKVTGIFKPLPANAHFHPQVMISFSTLNDSTIYGKKNLETNWGNNAFYTYLMLPENYPAKRLEASFPAFLDKYVPQNGKRQPAKPSAFTKLYLQKLTDIHLRSHLDDEAEPPGDIKRVYIFGAIALFILLIACINYMNLSTARSALRAREIGVRKVVGAQRREIISQFLSESVLVTLLSMALALVLTWLTLPLINTLSNQQLSLTGLNHWPILLGILMMPLAVGLLSGVYPALFMSSFKPSLVLKGNFKIGKGNISFRQILVIAQFAISIILIIATVVVFQQLKYMQQSALGYDKEHIISLNNAFPKIEQYESFRTELLRQPNIKDAALSSRIPTGRLLDEMGASVMAGDSLVPVAINLKFVATDFDFMPTFGVKMVAGRNFSRDFRKTDSANFLVNETAVNMLGWKTPDNAVGKDITYGGVKGKVIGVVRDFHFESMHQKIIPLIFLMNSNYYGNLSVKVTGQNLSATLAGIEKIWKKYLPETPFQFTFFDEKFASMYSSEEQQGKIFTLFSGIAIFIACLGLFGLSAFAITQRIKEIGIRKVLGASVSQIVSMMSKDFLRLVAIAAIIAFPVAWFAMHNWLQDFAYRVGLSWWVFVVAGIAAALIALITISFQAVKAGLANPVSSLRSE